MKSMEVVPPPSSIAGIRIAFEVTGTQRACSFKTDDAEARLRSSKREQLTTLSIELGLEAPELTEVIDLADSILSGNLSEVEAFANKFHSHPAKLASCRDRTIELLEKIANCKIELLPSKPFRTNISGVQTEVISLILKEKSTDVMIFVASHPHMDTEVYSAKKAPNGITELVSRQCDAAQLFRNIIKGKN